MNLANFILKSSRKIYRTVARPRFIKPDCEYNRIIANQLIYSLLVSDDPCMISRLGSTETSIILNYLSIVDKSPFWKKYIRYVTTDIGMPIWDDMCLKYCERYSGIFPAKKDLLAGFSKQYLNDMQVMDLIGSFQYGEKYLPLSHSMQYVHLECLYPFFVDNPWTKALEGKKVLVIHPFEHTIRRQYDNRKLLFNNENVLPDFELKIIRAVQTLGGADTRFKDWFEALHYMEKQVDGTDFDICLLGCGAYGLPLAAYIKRMGKKAVHIGGGLQLMFGIKGKRWDNNAYHWKDLPQLDTNYSQLYNEYWVRANENETPTTAQKVEGACYW